MSYFNLTTSYIYEGSIVVLLFANADAGWLAFDFSGSAVTGAFPFLWKGRLIFGSSIFLLVSLGLTAVVQS
jgi:hypothetical protein